MRPGVVCTPLRAERAALYGAVTTRVIRTGPGPLRTLADPSGPIAVAGVAGALDADLRPGDIVVADTLHRDGAPPLASPAGALLCGALRRHGLRARLGPVYSAAKVVHGARRELQAATGAVAVDTESAFLAAQAPEGQTVVLRTIVDTPDHPLLRPGTPWRGVLGLRALRAAAPVLDQWAAATGAREIVVGSSELGGADVSAEFTTAELTNVHESDLVLVLGPADVPETRGLLDRVRPARAQAVAAVADIELGLLASARQIFVIPGASAPVTLAADVVRALSGLGPTTVRSDAAGEHVRINPATEVI